MSITLNVPQYSVTEDTVYWNDLFEEHKNLPMLCIGRDSYIEETQVEAGPDQDLLYSIQVGRYSSIARDTKMIIDLNHDYKRVCQGRISGVAYQRPHLTRRKGQIVIMNGYEGCTRLCDCCRESSEGDRIPVRAGADCCTQ